jgi:quercetin dioxygenase-like cupin family protein
VRQWEDTTVKIEFFDLNAADGWDAATSYDQSSSSQLWDDGGPLAQAPVDMEATFEGSASRSARVDGDFNMAGVRLVPGFTVPWHSNNLRELIVVMGGDLTVESDDGDKRTIGLGEFCISEANAKHSMTAGREGASYIETWPVWVQVVTTWYDGPGWVRR